MEDKKSPATGAALKPPQVQREAPESVPLSLLQDLETLLSQRYGGALEDGERIRVDAKTGAKAAWLQARVGTSDRGHEFELFTRDVADEGLDGALGLLVDFLDGVLEAFFAAARDAYLPLEFAARRFEDTLLFARSEYRDYTAEAAAEALLEGRTVPGPSEKQ